MKKTRRILVLVVMTIMVVMTLTACAFTKGKEDNDIAVRWNEKEAFIYTNKTCFIQLEFSISQGEDVVQISKKDLYMKGTTSTFKIEDLTTGYLTEQAVIQEVNAYRIIIVWWVWVILIFIGLLIWCYWRN